MKCADESEIAPSALAKDGSLYVQCFEAADHVATPRAGSAAYPPIAAVRGARRQRQSWAKSGPAAFLSQTNSASFSYIYLSLELVLRPKAA